MPSSLVTNLSASANVTEEAAVPPSITLSSAVVDVTPSNIFNSVAVDVTPSNILSSEVVAVTPSKRFISVAVAVTATSSFIFGEVNVLFVSVAVDAVDTNSQSVVQQ